MVWTSPAAQRVKNLPEMQEIQEMSVRSLGREDSLEEQQQPTPVFLPEKSRGQRSLANYNPKGCKELDTIEQLSTSHLKKWFLNGLLKNM